jgi:hypothetical protein
MARTKSRNSQAVTSHSLPLRPQLEGSSSSVAPLPESLLPLPPNTAIPNTLTEANDTDKEVPKPPNRAAKQAWIPPLSATVTTSKRKRGASSSGAVNQEADEKDYVNGKDAGRPGHPGTGDQGEPSTGPESQTVISGDECVTLLSWNPGAY